MSRMLRFSVVILSSLLASSSALCAQHAKSTAHWSYSGATGPTHWASLSPTFEMCRAGREQSPVDITRTTAMALEPIRFDYHPVPLHVINNGHTIQVTYSPGSAITVGGQRYVLQQFHFHHPSEEQIHDRGTDMVVHLVHADSAGHLAVVAVLLRSGASHPLIQEIWAHLPAGVEQEADVPGTTIDASRLLPTDHGYYTFAGSLTTPPCSEHVTWIVMKQPVEISADQIRTFSRLYPHNARPIQRLNGREVLESR